jgi:two-component system, chemotaxis family, chemotaxis protein CheY
MPSQFKILIADDSSTLREYIRLPLLYAGHETCEAMDGLEALGICQNQAFDLIICDNEMPFLGGVGFVRQIKQEMSSFATPVLLLLDASFGDQASEARQVGIKYFLTKPFSVQKLLDTVKEILDKEKK